MTENGDEDRYLHQYNNPVERFAQLPEPTRQWLENLREDDIKQLNEAIRFYDAARVGGRFIKWLIITVVAIFVGAAAFGEAIQKIWTLISGRGHPS